MFRQIKMTQIPFGKTRYPFQEIVLFRDHNSPPTATSMSFFVISSHSHLFSTIFFKLSLFAALLKLLSLFRSLAFMAEEESSPGSPHTLKNRLRSSLCFSCCFPHQRVRPKMVRSASLRNKPRSTDFPFPQLKEKCCNFINRIGGHQRRRHSADFHYDALSYALNFEDDSIADDRSLHDLKSFSARLPASPPPQVLATSTAAIATATATA